MEGCRGASVAAAVVVDDVVVVVVVCGCWYHEYDDAWGDGVGEDGDAAVVVTAADNAVDDAVDAVAHVSNVDCDDGGDDDDYEVVVGDHSVVVVAHVAPVAPADAGIASLPEA